MTRGRTRAAGQAGRPWWRSRRNRIRFWLAFFGAVVVGLVIALLYLRASVDAPEEAVTLGEQVKPFELPDVVTGRTVSLSDYLGKREIVIVGYMGWF